MSELIKWMCGCSTDEKDSDTFHLMNDGTVICAVCGQTQQGQRCLSDKEEQYA